MIKLKNLNKYEAYGSGIPTGWKERAISVDDDEQEAAVEEILAYAKRDDDKIEWDVDYNGGAFADSRVFYIYSDGATFEEVRHTVRQMKDDAIYGKGVYEGCHNKRKKKKLKKEDSYGYVHDEDEAKLSTTQRRYLSKRGWEPITVDDKMYYTMDFQGNEPCEIYIDEWGNCYLVMWGYDLTPTDMFYTITETNTNVIDDLITLGNTITSTGDVDSAMSVFFG